MGLKVWWAVKKQEGHRAFSRSLATKGKTRDSECRGEGSNKGTVHVLIFNRKTLAAFKKERD